MGVVDGKIDGKACQDGDTRHRWFRAPTLSIQKFQEQLRIKTIVKNAQNATITFAVAMRMIANAKTHPARAPLKAPLTNNVCVCIHTHFAPLNPLEHTWNARLADGGPLEFTDFIQVSKRLYSARSSSDV